MGACQKGQEIWQVSAQMTSALEGLRSDRDPAGGGKQTSADQQWWGKEKLFLQEGFWLLHKSPSSAGHPRNPPGWDASCQGARWSQVGGLSFLRPFCKPHKCEKSLTVLKHMNRKPPSRTDVFQISPSARHAPGLEESRTCEISSAVLVFGEGEILFLGIFHPFLPQLQTRGKQNS